MQATLYTLAFYAGQTFLCTGQAGPVHLGALARRGHIGAGCPIRSSRICERSQGSGGDT